MGILECHLNSLMLDLEQDRYFRADFAWNAAHSIRIFSEKKKKQKKTKKNKKKKNIVPSHHESLFFSEKKKNKKKKKTSYLVIMSHCLEKTSYLVMIHCFEKQMHQIMIMRTKNYFQIKAVPATVHNTNSLNISPSF